MWVWLLETLPQLDCLDCGIAASKAITRPVGLVRSEIVESEYGIFNPAPTGHGRTSHVSLFNQVFSVIRFQKREFDEDEYYQLGVTVG